MKGIIKSFRFWFALISVIIIIQNVSGWDDKNLLLYFTTPPLLIMNEWFSFQMDFGESTMLIFYICNFVSWFLCGFLLDLLLKRIVARIKTRNRS